mmetsp:Transcript_5078/g.17953  ORF Transcript_5078/g.17953 Transcript_5078/m.17953 type:complete len:80 (+) Transcript_5078:585-824(+)
MQCLNVAFCNVSGTARQRNTTLEPACGQSLHFVLVRSRRGATDSLLSAPVGTIRPGKERGVRSVDLSSWYLSRAKSKEW